MNYTELCQCLKPLLTVINDNKRKPIVICLMFQPEEDPDVICVSNAKDKERINMLLRMFLDEAEPVGQLSVPMPKDS